MFLTEFLAKYDTLVWKSIIITKIGQERPEVSLKKSPYCFYIAKRDLTAIFNLNTKPEKAFIVQRVSPHNLLQVIEGDKKLKIDWGLQNSIRL